MENHSWHMDGNHKLVHWGIVIHGCIDGFSRKLIYCEVSDNNKGRQVKEYFIAAIRREGYPCAIRVDYGVENRASARVQWALRHLSEGAVLTGSSTRNTRIERTWRDITERVSKFYIEYLDHLSGFGVGPDFQIDRWLVHYLLVPRMKEDLSEFVMAHNNHPIRTMNQKSPLQLLSLHSADSYASFDNLEEVIMNVGLDEDEEINQWLVNGQIQILPRIQCPLSDEMLEQFLLRISPMKLSETRDLLLRSEESVSDQRSLVWDYLDFRFFQAKELLVNSLN